MWFCFVLCSSGTFLRAVSGLRGIWGECSARQVAVAALGLVARTRPDPMAGLSPSTVTVCSFWTWQYEQE